MTASQMFKEMSPALAQRVLDELATADKDVYRVAVAAVAQAKKVRPVFLERQSRPDRHRSMATGLARTDLNMIAGNVISGWLVKTQSALLTDFLDALKIKNEKGVVEDLPATVGDTELNQAVELLLGKHPAEAVALYLHAFYAMNEAQWPNLQKILSEDTRLMLGA
jgi:hypothetical protein